MLLKQISPRGQVEQVNSVSSRLTRDGWNCGWAKAPFYKRTCSYLAYEKKCKECNKLNHFAAQCCTPTGANKEGHRWHWRSVPCRDLISGIRRLTNNNLSAGLESGCPGWYGDTMQLMYCQWRCTRRPRKTRYKLANITLGKSHITAYDGTTPWVVGTVTIHVSQRTNQYNLHCKIVNCTNMIATNHEHNRLRAVATSGCSYM